MQFNRTPADWWMFFLLAALWSSAYPLTRFAVGTDDQSNGLPPEVVVAGRLTLATVILLAVMWWKGERWPPLSDVKRWSIMAFMGTLGTVAPFIFLSFAQRDVDSSLAALYLSAAPLFVAVLAGIVFRQEALTMNTALGLTVGFAGIVVLFGPEAVQHFGSADMIAQAFCLLATLCYAGTTIAARFMPKMSATAFSAGFISISMVTSWFGLIITDFSQIQLSTETVFGTIGLGVFPTALAAIVYMTLVSRTNATFIGLTGYVIPIFSIIFGYLIFQETQNVTTILAFFLILAGVWISQKTVSIKSPPVPEDV